MSHGTAKSCHLSLVGSSVLTSRAPLPGEHARFVGPAVAAEVRGFAVTRTVVRTALGHGVTVAATRLDDGGWLIALSDTIKADSVEEHMALATAERAIALWMMGFRQPEGGVDSIDMWPRVEGPRVDPAPRMVPTPRPATAPRMLRAGFAASAIAPLTALAAVVAAFHDQLAPIFYQ